MCGLLGESESNRITDDDLEDVSQERCHWEWRSVGCVGCWVGDEVGADCLSARGGGAFRGPRLFHNQVRRDYMSSLLLLSVVMIFTTPNWGVPRATGLLPRRNTENT